MFCVIQEIKTKRQNKDGYPKELKSEYMSCHIFGEDCGHYYHYYSGERFEREVRKAYRISLHHSYREHGKVKKKQIVLCTVNYYDLATDCFTVYDWCGSKIELAAKELDVNIDDIYGLVETKIAPLQEKVMEEFSQTLEYKVHETHEITIALYEMEKTKFAKKYGVDEKEYDRCFDVFGELRNPEYFEEIKSIYEARKKYEQKSRSYYEKYYNNYSGGDSGHSGNASSNQVGGGKEDKDTLKRFYRVLSKKFHPDSNPGKDTSKEMKLLNQLKQEWGV